ncbi:MAG: metallophosphoesterase family protein [Bacillota bacterium]
MVSEIKLNIPVRRIGVVSDTHIPTRARSLPKDLCTVLKGVQLILHAGDLVSDSVLDDLQVIAPVQAVSGNMDPPELRALLGRLKLVHVGSLTFGLVHGDGTRGSTLQRAVSAFAALKPSVIIFGHSHFPHNEYHADTLIFNPGSAVDPRRAPGRSCGILTLKGASVRGEIIYF